MRDARNREQDDEWDSKKRSIRTRLIPLLEKKKRTGAEKGEIAIKVYGRGKPRQGKARPIARQGKVTQVGGRNGFLGSRVVGANGTTDRG